VNKQLKDNTYDTRSVKEMILYHARIVCFQIGRLNGENTHFEEEITANAVNRVLDEDMGSREEFIELLSISYMLRGIADNLRIHIASNGTEDDEPEDDESDENAF